MGEVKIIPCLNGVVDAATPVIVRGKHIASLFTGQVLFEKPDIERFKQQAKKYGYDTRAYLKAVRELPVVTEVQLRSSMNFLGQIALMIAELGLEKLTFRETHEVLEIEIAGRKRSQALQESLFRIAQAADTAPTLDVLFSKVHSIIKGVIPANNFYIALFDEEKETLSYPYFVDEVDTPLPPGPVGRGLTAYVLRTGKSLLCDEKMDEELRRTGEIELVGIPSPIWLGVPLKTDGKTMGIMVVQHYTDPCAYSERDLQMLEFVSAEVAHAIARKKSEERIQEQLHRLEALHKIDLAISSAMHLDKALILVLEQVVRLLGVDAACILLMNTTTMELEHRVGMGFYTDALQKTSLRLGEGYAGKAAETRRVLHIPNLPGRTTDFLRSPHFSSEGFVSYFAVPLIAKDQVKGVLEVFHRSELSSSQEWLDFLETLAGQAAIVIDNAEMFDDLQRLNAELMQAYDSTLLGWSHALDLRDRDTEGHTLRVTEMTIELARRMGVPEGDIVHIRRGALLHDIGKMGIPDSILHKTGSLTEDEWAIMRRHPEFARSMLSTIEYLHPALDIPYCHHENWDGTGYPQVLKGEDIPLAARIFAVVDMWDALCSDRPYRRANPPASALEVIRHQSGKRLDPKVVDAFLAMLEEQSGEKKSRT